MAAQIEIGRFQWVTRTEAGFEFTCLFVNDVEVGNVAEAVGRPGFHYILTADPEWPSNETPLATKEEAKDRLAHLVRCAIAETPGNDYQAYYAD